MKYLAGLLLVLGLVGCVDGSSLSGNIATTSSKSSPSTAESGSADSQRAKSDQPIAPAADDDALAALAWKARLEQDLVYHSVDGVDLKLDVFVPDAWLGEPPWWATTGGKKPALLYIHGGGFVGGDKESRQLRLLPFISREWVVINIDYRLAKSAKAPAAVADCLAALRWVFDNAEKYQIDTDRVVVSGESAGGHLALMTGMLREGDSLCGDKYVVGPTNQVAAIINWYGITDFTLHAAHQRKVTQEPHAWFDPHDDHAELTRSLSPVNYVRKGGVPVISIHGSDDPAVLAEQPEMLHRKLSTFAVKQKLVMINGKKHGDFSPHERTRIFKEIWDFLEE